MDCPLAALTFCQNSMVISSVGARLPKPGTRTRPSLPLRRSTGLSQTKRGARFGATVTLKLQDAVSPPALLTVQVTVEVPRGKDEPEGGTQLVLRSGEHSPLALTLKLTTAEVAVAETFARRSPGQTIWSGAVMVRVKLHRSTL